MPSTNLKTGTLQASTQEAINAAAQAQASATAAQGYAASITGAVAAAINAEDGAETAYQNTIATQSAILLARKDTLEAKDQAQQAAQTSQIAVTQAQTYQSGAETAQTAAQAAKNAAEQAAQTSGANSNSASDAKTAAETARDQAVNAVNSIGTAVTRAETAASTAANAQTLAVNAGQSATNSATTAVQAKNAAIAAAAQAQQSAGIVPYLHLQEAYNGTAGIPDAANTAPVQAGQSAIGFPRNLNTIVSTTIPNVEITTESWGRAFNLPAGRFRVRGFAEAGLVPRARMSLSGPPAGRPTAVWQYGSYLGPIATLPLDTIGNPRGGLIPIQLEFTLSQPTKLCLLQIQDAVVAGQFPNPGDLGAPTVAYPFVDIIIEKLG